MSTPATSEIDFSGQVVIVTGAAGALGRSYAKAFAARGASLLINDPGTTLRGEGSRPDVAEELAREIRASGGIAVANQDSVADRQGASHMVQQAMDSFGRIDVLVNNAGVMRDKVFKKMDLDDFDAVLQINLAGAAYVTHAAFPHMIHQNRGRIVMITSASGLYGVFGAANYSAAKMGLVGLMNTLRIEGQRHHVAVNSVAPVATSRMTEALIRGESLIDNEALGKLAPEWITPLVLFLASSQCELSGEIIEAGAGYFARVAIVEGQGVRLGTDAEITPEQIQQRLSQIRDLSEARPFPDCPSLIEHIVSA